MRKPSKPFLKKPDLRIQCGACETIFGDTDKQCPKCGCKTVRFLPKIDVRKAFAVDDRQNGPI